MDLERVVQQTLSLGGPLAGLGGGGVASLRNDPQAKGYSQILLQTPIPIPRMLAETL